MRSVSAVRSAVIAPSAPGPGRSIGPAVEFAVLAPGLSAAVDQIGHPISDRSGDQQRRRRVLVDVARHVFTGARALVIDRLRRWGGLLAGAVRQILGGLAGLRHCRAGLLGSAVRHVARRSGRAGLVAATPGILRGRTGRWRRGMAVLAVM